MIATRVAAVVLWNAFEPVEAACANIEAHLRSIGMQDALPVFERGRVVGRAADIIPWLPMLPTASLLHDRDALAGGSITVMRVITLALLMFSPIALFVENIAPAGSLMALVFLYARLPEAVHYVRNIRANGNWLQMRNELPRVFIDLSLNTIVAHVEAQGTKRITDIIGTTKALLTNSDQRRMFRGMLALMREDYLACAARCMTWTPTMPSNRDVARATFAAFACGVEVDELTLWEALRRAEQDLHTEQPSDTFRTEPIDDTRAPAALHHRVFEDEGGDATAIIQRDLTGGNNDIMKDAARALLAIMAPLILGESLTEALPGSMTDITSLISTSVLAFCRKHVLAHTSKVSVRVHDDRRTFTVERGFVMTGSSIATQELLPTEVVVERYDANARIGHLNGDMEPGMHTVNATRQLLRPEMPELCKIQGYATEGQSTFIVDLNFELVSVGDTLPEPFAGAHVVSVDTAAKTVTASAPATRTCAFKYYDINGNLAQTVASTIVKDSFNFAVDKSLRRLERKSMVRAFAIDMNRLMPLWTFSRCFTECLAEHLKTQST